MTKNLSIHATQGMQELEKQQINDWLSDWLVEAEAASAAREVPRTHTHTHTHTSRDTSRDTFLLAQELRQLRWYAQELQHSVLREMALAVPW